MAKCKNPLMSQEARGGISGYVYNTWRGISYVKSNTSPTGQGTPLRLLAQARLATIAKLWATATDAQRADWAAYALAHPVSDWTGNPLRLTAANWFTGCNVQLAILGVAPILDAPVVGPPPAASGFTLATLAGNLQSTWTSPTDEHHTLKIFLAGPLSPGVAARREQAKFLINFDGDTAQPGVLLMAPAPGRYTAFAVVVDNANGLTSTLVSSFVDIP